MKSYIHDDFLLEGKTARRLYHDVAEALPIIDYHCHLSPALIAKNHQFRNLYEIWLAGDHYKWRAMRANGVAERFCSGDATDIEKFMAWAGTVPYTLRNPLYHWTHLELKRYFGIDELLDEKSAPRIWEKANAMLQRPEMSVWALLEKSNVEVACTTDDPVDSLEFHFEIQKSALTTKVYPTFRPDKALWIEIPSFNGWVDSLEQVSGLSCANLGDFLAALDQRHAFFHSLGCRSSDHGIERCYADACSEAEAKSIYDAARAGRTVSREAADKFRSFMMLFFGRLDYSRGWVKQLHFGVLRNNNSRLMRQLGPDTGFDAIGDFSQAQALVGYLNALDQEGHLPKTIIYNINPADNYVIGTVMGCFQDGSIPGKIQFGSGWWFLDQKEGMEWQLNALSSLGLLRRFVGMLTDSRCFLSYTRHEYFRRILCQVIGRDVERGELPDVPELMDVMIRDICHDNASRYFLFPSA
ncbi:MAG: glucuronate isomerase [bacterium]